MTLNTSGLSGHQKVPAEEDVFRCQFCGRWAAESLWRDNACPHCGREYAWMLAQDEETE